MSTEEPETWLGNVPPDYCESGCCKSCAESAKSFEFNVGPGDSFDMSDFTVTGVAAGYCLRCGLPHAAGECKRGER